MRKLVLLLLALCLAVAVPALAAETPLPWVIALQDGANGGKPLVLVLEGTEKLSATAYTSVDQLDGITVDVSKLKRTADAVTGEVTLSLPDAKAPIAASYTLDASVKDGALTGKYTGKEGDKAVTGTLKWGRDLLPLGHAQFYPSPDRPVGYRGDGNGVFPGARLPASFMEEDKDVKEKNIVWKTKLPMFGNNQPVVVGKKVFVKGEPNLLICVDADSGKVLWSKAVNAWELGGVDKAVAEKIAALYDIRQYVEPFWGAMVGDGTMTWKMPYEQFNAVVEIYLKSQPKILAALKEIDPGGSYDAAGASVLLGLEDIVAQKKAGTPYDNHQKLRGDINAIRKAIDDRINGLGKTPGSPVDKRGRAIPITLVPPWYNLVGFSMATPVSDGERVYVTFGQGQIAAYDLDGNRLWGQLIYTANSYSGGISHIPSPQLADGVLMVNIDHTTIVGLDAMTGKQLWQTDVQGPGGYSPGSHKVVHLANDKDKVTALVTESCKVVRVSDGVIIGTLPFEKGKGGGSSIINIDNLVFKGGCGDSSNAPYTAFKLTLVDRDNVTAEKVKELGKSCYMGSVITPSLQVFQSDDQGASIIMVGGKLFYGSGSNSFRDPKSRVGNFRIATNNNGKPQIISANNMLIYHQPSVPAMEKYAPELYDILPSWSQNSAGVPYFFTYVDTNDFAQGDRLYIKSSSYLYCIGNAVMGKASDDGKTVAAINDSKTSAEIAPYLISDSAQYRCTAIKRLVSLGDIAAQSDALYKLAENDNYEEVRLAALQALDKIDKVPGTAFRALLLKKAEFDVDTDIRLLAIRSLDRLDDKPGTALLREKIKATFKRGAGDPLTQQTLKGLGPDADNVLSPLLDITKPNTIQEASLLATGYLSRDAIGTRDTLLSLLKNRGTPAWMYRIVADSLARIWCADPADPAVIAAFDGVFATFARDADQAILPVLATARTGAALIEVLQRGASKSNDANTRESCFNQLAEMALRGSNADEIALRPWIQDKAMAGDAFAVRVIFSLPDGPALQIKALEAIKDPYSILIDMFWRDQNHAAVFARWGKMIETADENRLRDLARYFADMGIRRGEPEVRKQVIATMKAILAKTTKDDTKKTLTDALKKVGAAV